MKRDERTYGRIREKYDAWMQNEAERPERDRLRRVDHYEHVPQGSSEMSRLIPAVIGFGIAVLLLALAGYAFYTSGFYGDHVRDGAQTGYAVVGVFLLIAGIGGLFAVYNHNFRVLTRPPSHH